MQQPPRRQPLSRREPPHREASLVEARPARELEPARTPTPVLLLDSLSRLPPATAITIILTVAGMTLGAVVAIVAVLGMVLATVAAVAAASRWLASAPPWPPSSLAARAASPAIPRQGHPDLPPGGLLWPRCDAGRAPPKCLPW